MKTKLCIFPFMVMGFVLILTNSCKKDNNNDNTTQNSGIIFNSKLTYGTVTDISGNVYKTITIGTQTWMAENLKVTRYRNGDSIPKISDGTAWSNLTTGAYCDYRNIVSNGTTYGKLYNWYSIMDSRNICPTGWHIPNDTEWEKLYAYLGGYEQTTSDKLRETGITHWAYINDGATNASGFTALPGGMRDYGGIFTDIGQTCFLWSSTPAGDYYNLDADYYYLDSGANSGGGSKKNGLSVRCLKD
jgi:uncharacterized protein (TIGR02145 family)